jgi:hypothetical protein
MGCAILVFGLACAALGGRTQLPGYVSRGGLVGIGVFLFNVGLGIARIA